MLHRENSGSRYSMRATRLLRHVEHEPLLRILFCRFPAIAYLLVLNGHLFDIQASFEERLNVRVN